MASHETRRFLGIEVLGAKNTKTSVSVLEYYPREGKIFLLEAFDKIALEEDQSSDDALLHLIEELGGTQGIHRLGVSAPLHLPPCLGCTLKRCETAGCSLPAVKWMEKFLAQQKKGNRSDAKLRDFTPYTQRPIELWIRHRLLPLLPEIIRFEIDETLGGNKGPLAARMHYLKRRLRFSEESLQEIWPKLSVAVLGLNLGLPKNVIATYRHLEKGIESRERILHTLAKDLGIFMYERDLQRLSVSLSCFDSFICALTAWLSDIDACTKMPKGFPVQTGWVEYPSLKGPLRGRE